jgi:hypothetical protein
MSIQKDYIGSGSDQLKKYPINRIRIRTNITAQKANVTYQVYMMEGLIHYGTYPPVLGENLLQKYPIRTD